MTTAVKTKKEEKKKNRMRIPKELIYEMRYGSPIYYRDYDKVLSGEKTPEEVMGSGGLQALLVTVLVSFLHRRLKGKYIILSNELGYSFAPRSWYNLDIAIIPKERLKDIPRGYIKIPPEVVIEIDTKADLRKFESPQDYFHRKAQDLLDSGVKKVIWIFTKDKKIWLAEKGKPWLIVDFDYEIDVLEGISFKLSELLKEEGIKL